MPFLRRRIVEMDRSVGYQHFKKNWLSGFKNIGERLVSVTIRLVQSERDRAPQDNRQGREEAGEAKPRGEEGGWRKCSQLQRDDGAVDQFRACSVVLNRGRLLYRKLLLQLHSVRGRRVSIYM